MADWYGRSMLEDQDFEEEDVWGTVMKQENEESNTKVNKAHNKMKKKSWTSHESSGARMIPRCNDLQGRVPHQQQQSSAPMGIPDWSKIYNNKEKNKGPGDEAGENDDVDDDDDGGGKMVVPPHEYIARRLAARSHIASSSMCEGVGRTLKGRDLSKLRNAILTKTGFLEQK